MTTVMHVLAPSPVGGLERVVQSLAIAQWADPRVTDVRVVTLSSAPVRNLEPFLAPLERAGVRIHTIVTPGRAYARQRAELLALTEQFAPSIVHTHGSHADVIAVNLGEAVGAATVTTMHGIVGGGLRNRTYEWMQQRCCRQRDAVVSVSRPLARALVADGFAPERTHVVRNTWRPSATRLTRRDARERLGLPAEGFIVGWIGRISREKGLDVLIDALAESPMLDVHLGVIGEGRERPALAARAAATALGRLERVHWHGLVADASEVIAAFNVIVISSRTEGTPMLLLEAMGAGVPIISTAVGGIPDVIDGTEAVLVPSEDPRALTAAIDMVQRDATGARRRVLAATRRLSEDHDLQRWAARYSSVYRAALATAAFRRPELTRAARAARTTARRADPASRVAFAP